MRLHLSVVTLLLCVFCLSGCGGISFDVAQDLPEQRVAGSPLGGILPSFIPTAIPLQFDLKAETEKRSTGPASHVYLKSLTIAATPRDVPSGNFDFLEEVHIFVAPRDGGALPRVEIARLPQVPKGQFKLDLTIVPDVDLLPYINAGAEITSSARGSQPRKDFTFDGRIEITIKI